MCVGNRVRRICKIVAQAKSWSDLHRQRGHRQRVAELAGRRHQEVLAALPDARAVRLGRFQSHLEHPRLPDLRGRQDLLGHLVDRDRLQDLLHLLVPVPCLVRPVPSAKLSRPSP